MRPQDHAKLSQVELLIFDVAAAIPFTILMQLMKPYLILMLSTMKIRVDLFPSNLLTSCAIRTASVNRNITSRELQPVGHLPQGDF